MNYLVISWIKSRGHYWDCTTTKAPMGGKKPYQSPVNHWVEKLTINHVTTNNINIGIAIPLLPGFNLKINKRRNALNITIFYRSSIHTCSYMVQYLDSTTQWRKKRLNLVHLFMYFEYILSTIHFLWIHTNTVQN